MKLINCITILALIAMSPLGILLPEQYFWENELFENMEALVLFGGCVLSFIWLLRSTGERRWLFGAWSILFLIAFGRELSWGRVFYPVGMDAEGPVFMSIKEVWFGPYLPWVLGALIVVLFVALAKSRKLIITIVRKSSQDRVMQIYFCLFLLGLILGETIFERNMIDILDPYHQDFEELAELISYWSAIAFVYRIKEKWLSDK
ncbi:hypothetical protein [uncultured Veillonella sp.]|uniref:hypothetical protein n=1 Tax=uncultured Veillonella sp. TaxID=159268 RepID=UPI0025D489A4|nr:hypothetical protein [uncultured Veillonella sp.]MDY3974021.1 hypothetical protein [Veillonella caviae]